MKKQLRTTLWWLLVLGIGMLVIMSIVLLPRNLHAQSTQSYWCGAYWSYQPCGYQYPYQYQYNYVYPYTQNYYPYTQQYPYYNYQYYYPYAYPAPTCSITYSYTNHPGYWSSMYDQAITLSWNSNYASRAYISGVGEVSASGMRVVYPYGFTTYTMTTYGPGGTNTCATYYQPQRTPAWPQYYWSQVGYTNGYYY